MLSCTSSNQLTREKNKRVPQNLDNQKMDRLWNRVEHWPTNPIGYCQCQAGKQPKRLTSSQICVHQVFTGVDRVSDPMLNPVPKSVHFFNHLNFGALLDFFLWSICWNLCNLALVIVTYMLVNIELAKFV